MSSGVMKLSKALEKEKDPLKLHGDVQIKQELDELDNFEGAQRVINVNDSSIKKKVVQILPFKKDQPRKEDLGLSTKTVEIKKEAPCNCMQNVEYYCNKCNKTLLRINEVKLCSKCNNQLKLKCRLCHKRYKLLQSIYPLSISANAKKEIEIKEEGHFSCFKCSFKTVEKMLLDNHIITHNHQPGTLTANCSSTLYKTIKEEVLFCQKCEFFTKNKEILNRHILKSHWQPKFDVNVNCDDDMYIELLCKKCQKICRKVVYEDLVKLVCRECQVPMLYRCTLCCTGYKLLKNVRYHVKCVCPYRTNNEKFYCSDCTFKTETKGKLESHIVKEHLNYQCLNCHKIFEDNDALREHVMEHCAVTKDNIDPVKLELPCKEPTDTDEKFVIIEYNPHILVKRITGKSPKYTKEWRNLIDYLCLKCGGEAKKTFARYKPWCRKCNLKYDYRCISCEKLYGNYDRIQRHVKFYCPNRLVFECPVCKYSASKKSLLFDHIQNYHTIYKCMECFTNMEGYSTMTKHHIDCCRDSPPTAAQLEKLIRLYCKQCHKKPRKATTAAITECEKCTITLSYQCLKCFNVFDSQDLAYEHIKDLCKPNFNCEKCNFKTYTQEGLDVHIRYKHNSRMCPDCGVNFKDELIFQLHRREEMRRKRKEKKYDMTPTAHLKKFKAS